MKTWIYVVALLPLIVFVHGAASAVRYVNIKNTTPSAPYTNWTTAATNIQTAIDVASLHDQILVTNGVYRTGGRVVNGSMTNRVAVTKALSVQSVNGAGVTLIEGHQAPGNGDSAVRCVYLTSGAALIGFTITNGATRASGDSTNEQSGGGVFCSSGSAIVANCVLSSNCASAFGGGVYGGVASNCVLTGNSAVTGGAASSATLNFCIISNNSARNGGGGIDGGALNNSYVISNSANFGGGAGGAKLNNCVLAGNTANSGGGSYACILYSCTVVQNYAYSSGPPNGGGGTAYSSLTNCIVYYNHCLVNEPPYPNLNSFYDTMSYCCTWPSPSIGPGGVGPGNFTNSPLFLGQLNYRLQTNSPCINAGNTIWVQGTTDLDGRPRVVGGTLDVGAYECQSDVSGLFIEWLQQHRLSADGTADFSDADQDGMNNWQEWTTGTDPTDAASAFRMVSVTDSTSGKNVSWTSVTNRMYFVERSTNLAQIPAFSTVRSNIVGTAGTTSLTDTNVPLGNMVFYRVGVQQ